jgi:Raf kinase inhibitor-like YbhB/YbcL family protein
MLQGRNDFGNIGYGGPCPPRGTYRNFFRLFALTTELNLQAGISKSEIMKAIDGKIISTCLMMGRYKR